MNLSALDLNLLVSLDALLAERSVTRAARRVGLSQPAMSNALGRLRRVFNDPLLIRTGREMVPTARAEALQGAIRTALAVIEQEVLDAPRFDPRSAERIFRIACSDYVQMLVLPALVRRLLELAPGIRVEVIAPGGGAFAKLLEAGDADLAIGVSEESASGLQQQLLFTDRFHCVVRRDHPRIKRGITRRHLASERFVGVSRPGTLPWSLEEVLRLEGIERRLSLVLPSRMVAAFLTMKTDLVAMVSEKLGRELAATFPLRTLKLPVDLPEFRVHQFWHERQTKDPGHRWFRELVADVSPDSSAS